MKDFLGFTGLSESHLGTPGANLWFPCQGSPPCLGKIPWQLCPGGCEQPIFPSHGERSRQLQRRPQGTPGHGTLRWITFSFLDSWSTLGTHSVFLSLSCGSRVDQERDSVPPSHAQGFPLRIPTSLPVDLHFWWSYVTGRQWVTR